jgi:hypothetical protein
MSTENEQPTSQAGEEASKQPNLGETPSQPEGQSAGLGKYTAWLMALKEKNPLVFYGGIGALVLIVLGGVLLGGGGGEQAKVPTIQVGQTYKLVNPNVSGGGDVLLLQAPGRMGATDPELREKEEVCVVKAGTPAKVTEQTVVNYVKYVKVEPLSGDCQGKAGWTSLVNLKAE